MKGIVFLSLFVVVSSCTTSGTVDRSKKKTEPLLFRFSGSKNDMVVFLKQMLARNGFIIANEDKDAGIIVTQPKELAADETINMNAVSIALVGATTKEAGRIAIFYRDGTEGNVIAEIKCTAVLNFKYTSAFKKDEAMDEKPLYQGHPLPMKLRNIMSADGRFLDITPE